MSTLLDEQGNMLPQVLRKHVAAVHTSGCLSLVERKMVNILLINAYDQLVSSDGREARHQIPISLLGKKLGWGDSNNISSLKKALFSLQKTVLSFNLMKDGNESWESMSMLSYASIRNGICTYGYVSELAERLSDPEVFAIINVNIQNKFKGSYSLTLYENCVRYKNVRSTGWWDLDTFRRIMGATAETYNDYKRLSAFVIKKSVSEINIVSDIHITADFKRDGMKVVAIRFLVKDNPQKSLLGPNPFDDNQTIDIKASDLFKRLRKHGVGERLALIAIKEDPEQARLAIEKTEALDQAGSIKTNTGAYISSLISIKAELGPSEYSKQKRPGRKQLLSQETYNEILNDFNHLSTTTAIKALTPEDIRKLAEEFFVTLPSAKQVQAGKFNSKTGKFSSSTINAEFKPWLNKAARPTFSALAFDAYLTSKGYDPVEVRTRLQTISVVA